ncbi:PREDICTED: uncharacterized protein LOC108377547 [Rhagoletis zephyria]|uniref:uncharacterized protein LOC108377547 n=1 Tax=Rhagoletis zephyria TaxID=28612 RepID=UPI000811A67A|nr:PREDICTED: uncharacterized protein LOC108377547 [Rhagoletis zephyria]
MTLSQILSISSLLLGFSLRTSVSISMIKFTNIKCTTLDKPFADFRYCKLKALARDSVALSLRVDIFQASVNNVTVHVQTFKRFNGYRPFLFNITTNFCDFMRHKTRFKFLNMIFKILKAYSNINHSCPYTHDIIIDKLILTPEYFPLLPMPSGEYRINFGVDAYNDPKAIVYIYVLILD